MNLRARLFGSAVLLLVAVLGVSLLWAGRDLRPFFLVPTALGLLLAWPLSGRLARRLEAEVDREARRLADRPGGELAALSGKIRDLEAVFATLEDGLAVVDANGVVVRANPAFAAWTGRRSPEGHRVASLFRFPEVARVVEQGLDGRPETREVAFGERSVLVSAVPQEGRSLLVLRDLTRLRRLEGVRRDFVANVSHELKTPLTTIVGFAEALAGGEPSLEQRREFAGRILVNARRMRHLIDDLLDLARIESGRWEPAPEVVDPAEAARVVWSSLAPLPEEREVRLETAPKGPPLFVDPDALRQILRNLFDNALRYAPRGSAVRLEAVPEGEFVRLAVSDRGPGIPSVHLPRIFERFYRVDAARSREEGGTGLGLSIVKHLVSAHGGEVGAESELGRGTTVWLTLPGV